MTRKFKKDFLSEFEKEILKGNLKEKIEVNSQNIKDMGSHKSRIAKLEDDLIELGIQFEKSKTEG